MPAPRKTPADHQPKAADVDELDEYFSFSVGGNRYLMPRKTKDVMTPGWVRRNRRRDETDYFMTLLECLASNYDGADTKLEPEEVKAGEQILDVLDHLSWEDHRDLQKELADHIQVTMGE